MKRNDLPLRILVLKCQSIKSPGKPAQLSNIIESSQANIAIVTESWLKPSVNSPEVFPPNCKCYRRDRLKTEDGGVFLLVSDKYESEEPEEMKVDIDCELIWAKLKIKGSTDLYIGACYRPHDNRDSIYLDNLQTYLAKILAHKGAHIWLGGDFNLPGIDWQNENIKLNSQHTAECHQLLDINNNAFLDLLVLEPTRITETQSNTLDLFFYKQQYLSQPGSSNSRYIRP